MAITFRRWRAQSTTLLHIPILLSAAIQAGFAYAAPERIWFNGDIHTADLSAPAAQAFAIENGKFSAVGSNTAIRSLANENTELVDLAGKTVIPGIIDGHFHLFAWYEMSRGVNLVGIDDIPSWIERVQAKATEVPKGGWIVGGGWDHNAAGGEFPTAEQLDVIAPDHLVALGDIDHHTMWVNSRVLEKFNITADTPNPPGGEIVKDPETGKPTGILKETAAFIVWESDAFVPPKPEREKIWREAITHMNSLGITGMHNMGRNVGELEDLIELVEAGEFPLRMWYGVMVNSGEEVEQLLPFYRTFNKRAAQFRQTGPRLEFGYFKGLTDGVLSSRTAALASDYSDAPGERGKFFIKPSHINDIVRIANSENIPVALHAIGDKAVHAALDAFEQSPVKSDLPNRIEHIEVIQPGDLPRFEQLNVVASMQPQHAVGTIDPYIVQRIGKERSSLAYVWRKILDNGGKLALSSDWPTSPANPLAQIHAAVTRQSLEGTPSGGWYPDQALTFDEALYAMTQQSAVLSGWQKEVGSISEGKWADFVILDRPLPEKMNLDLLQMQVEATFIAGSAVYGSRTQQTAARQQ